MATNQKAIDDFLRRSLNDHRWMKELSEKEIDDALTDLNPDFRVPLRRHQKIGFLLAIACPHLYFQYEMGLGKAQPSDSLVITPVGWRAIGSLCAGDEIYGQDGERHIVKSVHHRGVLPTYRVHFNDGSSLVVSSDHLWAVNTTLQKWRNESWKVVSTNELLSQPLHDKNGNRRFHIPVTLPVRFSAKEFPMDPYVVGVLLGDGHAETPQFTPGDIDVVEAVKACGYTLSERDDGERSPSYYITNVMDLWRQLGFEGKRSWERRIPKEYLFGSIDQRIALLQGLMDTDGEFSSNLGYVTTSAGLLDDIIHLIESLGGTVKQTVKENPKYTYNDEIRIGRPAYRLSIKMPIFIQPFRVRHPEYKPNYKYMPARLIEAIEYEKEQEVVCISIDAKDGLYLTERFIVTHNTGMSLEIMAYLHKHNLLNKMMVLVPMNELVDGWIEEIEKWGINLPYVGLKGSTEQRWETYRATKRGLVLLSYPAMVHMTCTKQPVQGQKRQKMQPDKRLVADFVKGVDGIWYDEITKTKNHQSLTFRVANTLAGNARYRYGLAGRIFGRDPEGAWGQLYIIDRGATLSYSLNFFRDVFFIKKKRFFGGPYAFDYVFNRKMDDDFNRVLANSTLRFAAEDCDIDLPDRTTMKRQVTLPKSSNKYYQDAVAQIRAARGHHREVRNAFIRMRQISSGFLGFIDDESGDRAQIEFPENPKLDLLMELIDEMPDNRKAIIGVDFTWSGAMISKALHKAKLKHGWLYGGTKDWPTIKDKFDNDPDFRFLIVQSKKGAYGLNLQSANYIFYYESPVAVLDRLQSEARVNRQGQKHHVFIYDLVCKDTADESILAFHRHGKNLFDALVVNPDQALKEAA